MSGVSPPTGAHMKRLLLLLMLSVVLGACVASGIKPSTEEVQRVKSVHIVAMEPPPLALYPLYKDERYVYEVIKVIATGAWIQVAPGIGLYNTIPIMLQMPEAERRGGEGSQPLQGALDAKGIWVPTVAIASDVQAQLAPAGIVATVASDVKPIPDLQNRNYRLVQTTWLDPIRAWYNDTKPVADYAGLSSGQPVYVVEVGLTTYGINRFHPFYDNNLLLQVHMKVIDSSRGQVIGRASAEGKTPTLDPLDQTFADDAKRFKELFAAQARTLVRECLTELGFVR